MATWQLPDGTRAEQRGEMWILYDSKPGWVRYVGDAEGLLAFMEEGK